MCIKLISDCTSLYLNVYIIFFYINCYNIIITIYFKIWYNVALRSCNLYANIGHASLVSRHISLLCYFAIFIHVPVPKNSNELRIIPETGVIATAETAFECFIGFHPTKPHLEGGNYNADKL